MAKGYPAADLTQHGAVSDVLPDGPVSVTWCGVCNTGLVFRADVKGALAVLVPYTPPTRAVRLNVTLDEGLLELVDHAARDAGETRSGWLANAARRRLCEDYPAAGERKRA